MELMLKASNWENKVKKEEGKYLIVLMFATVEKMFPVEIYSLIWVCRDQRWLIQLVDPSAVAAQIYVNQGIFSISLIYVVKSYYILNYKHMGVLWTIKNALSFILKLNCWLYFYFWACFVYMQKSSIFMNAFNFLLVLMTVKGTKCEFTVDWLKTGKENKKLHNAFIYFPANTVSHPRPCKTNVPSLFSQMRADLHIVELVIWYQYKMVTYGSYWSWEY